MSEERDQTRLPARVHHFAIAAAQWAFCRAFTAHVEPKPDALGEVTITWAFDAEVFEERVRERLAAKLEQHEIEAFVEIAGAIVQRNGLTDAA